MIDSDSYKKIKARPEFDEKSPKYIGKAHKLDNFPEIRKILKAFEGLEKQVQDYEVIKDIAENFRSKADTLIQFFDKAQQG